METKNLLFSKSARLFKTIALISAIPTLIFLTIVLVLKREESTNLEFSLMLISLGVNSISFLIYYGYYATVKKEKMFFDFLSVIYFVVYWLSISIVYSNFIEKDLQIFVLAGFSAAIILGICLGIGNLMARKNLTEKEVRKLGETLEFFDNQ